MIAKVLHKNFLRLLAALFIALLGMSAVAQAAVVQIGSTINDEAEMMSFHDATALKEKLLAYRKKTGNQIAILTVETDDGSGIREYTRRVFLNWRVGKRSDNQIALIAVDVTQEVGAVQYAPTDSSPPRRIPGIPGRFSTKSDGTTRYLNNLTAKTISFMNAADKGPPPDRGLQTRVIAYLSLLLIPVFPWLGAVLSRAQSHIWGGTIVAVMMSASLTALLGLWPGLGIAAVLVAYALLTDWYVKKAFRGRRSSGGRIPFWAGGDWGRPIDQEDMEPQKGVDMRDI